VEPTLELEPGELAPGVELAQFLPYLLNRISSRLNANLASDLRALGVPLQHYRVLAVLVAGKGATVNELAVYTVTEQSTLSKLLARMERAGLIDRSRAGSDGRVVSIAITPAGRRAYADIIPLALKHYGLAIEGLSEDEHRSLLVLLNRVLDNVREEAFP